MKQIISDTGFGSKYMLVAGRWVKYTPKESKGVWAEVLNPWVSDEPGKLMFGIPVVIEGEQPSVSIEPTISQSGTAAYISLNIPQQKKCDCQMQTLLREGCQCGGK